MKFDYSRLRGKIRELFGTQEAFAKEIGMSSASLSAKLNNQVDFSQSEINRAAELLEIDTKYIPVYFFTAKVKEI